MLEYGGCEGGCGQGSCGVGEGEAQGEGVGAAWAWAVVCVWVSHGRGRTHLGRDGRVDGLEQRQQFVLPRRKGGRSAVR